MSRKESNPIPDGGPVTIPSPPRWEAHRALSRPLGLANQPRDFDWVTKNIPCQAACPAGTDIPGYLDAIAQGRYEEAYRINLRDNVFPAVLGRVCTRPCEPACRHGWQGLGESVAICFAKRSADDFMRRGRPIKLEPVFPPTGKKVAVVGAGAAGLTAARELALGGHRPTVFEKAAKPGGLMVQGIPPFRLPRAVVEREIEQVRLCGVEIVCRHEIGASRPLAALLAEYDAVVVAAGALRPRRPEVPGVRLPGVRHGLDFLREANERDDLPVGNRVVVIGGGFTAVDCARTARRLGAAHVAVYYRRTEAEMYLTPGEIEEMRREGIFFETLAAPAAFVESGGRLAAVRLVRTRLGDSDESGRLRPVEIAGSGFEVPVDTVLLATGQTRDTDWVTDRAVRARLDAPGTEGGADPRTGDPRLFVTGDFAYGAESLIHAIGHAKACARAVDRFLMGRDRWADAVRVEDAKSTGRTREMDRIPRQPMPSRPPAERTLRAEVETGFEDPAARQEARRCYLCHFKYEIDTDTCIYCDRCLKVKPVDKCIVKVASMNYDREGRIVGYQPSSGSRDYNLLYIDQNECIRCGACAEVCPVECIALQKVSQCTLPIDQLNRALALRCDGGA